MREQAKAQGRGRSGIYFKLPPAFLIVCNILLTLQTYKKVSEIVYRSLLAKLAGFGSARGFLLPLPHQNFDCAQDDTFGGERKMCYVGGKLTVYHKPVGEDIILPSYKCGNLREDDIFPYSQKRCSVSYVQPIGKP